MWRVHWRFSGMNYAWINLAGLMLVYGCLCGAITYGYGVFLPTMAEHFNWNRSALSGPYSLFYVIGGLLGPVAGTSVSRFGARRNMVVCNLLAVAGLFTAPLFVLLFSVLFRGQRVGVVRWAAVLAGFAGALLVIQPDEGALGWASAVPVLAGVFYATGALATRSWCEGEGTMPMVFSYFVILALGGLAGLAALAIWPQPAVDGPAGFVARGWVWPEGTVLFWIVVQAVTAIAAVGCLTRGYQIGEATYVAVNEYSLILFATVFAFLFWGQAVGTGALIGMALIVAAGMVITLRSDPSEAEAPAAMPAGAMTVIEEGEAGP